MEAALRMVVDVATGSKFSESSRLKFDEVRGLEGVKVSIAFFLFGTLSGHDK